MRYRTRPAPVTDDEASRALWLDKADGAIAGLRPGALAIESSTLTPAWIRELGAGLGARGARFLDALVVGTLPQAESGALIYHELFATAGREGHGGDNISGIAKLFE